VLKTQICVTRPLLCVKMYYIFCVCVSVALLVREANRMRSIIVSVACLSLPYFFPYRILKGMIFEKNSFHHRHHHHHHISVMELGHLLTRSGLTYPEVTSKVCHDSFCQLGNSVSLPWGIYYGAFYLYVVSIFSCIPVICLKLVLFLIPLQFVHLFCNLSKCVLLFFSCISSLLLLLFCRPLL